MVLELYIPGWMALYQQLCEEGERVVLFVGAVD